VCEVVSFLRILNETCGEAQNVCRELLFFLAIGSHFGRSLQLAAMEMIFRFSGDGKLVHATGPPQAKIWKIARAFATICT
jgi:hypothetical protein